MGIFSCLLEKCFISAIFRAFKNITCLGVSSCSVSFHTDRGNKIFFPVQKHISKLYLLFKKKSKPEEQNFQVSNPDEHFIFISDTFLCGEDEHIFSDEQSKMSSFIFCMSAFLFSV